MKREMTREAASRIQSAACLAGGGVIKAGSFAARAMSAAYKNEPFSKPISQATGIPSPLVKVGLFALAGVVATATVYHYKDDLIKSCSSWICNSQ